MVRPLILFPVLVALSAIVAFAETRHWTDATGQFRVEAEFGGYAEGNVTLNRTDGESVTVPMSKLSRADQTWVRAHLREMRAGGNKPARGESGTKPTESSSSTPTGDWLAWRGPLANNVALGPAAPAAWTESQNVLWKVPIPGRGHSSPILIGDRIYLTSADENRKTTGVFAFDKNTGEVVWQTPVTQGGFQTDLHPKNTHATSTLASNGKQLFAVFIQNNSVQLIALDLQGKMQWQINAGQFSPQEFKFGYGPSPILYEDMVIVAGEFEKGWIAAFSQKDGKPRWKVPRPGISFSTPIVAKVAGKDQMLISGLNMVCSYDPKTGKELWSAPGTSRATCGTIVWDGDTIFASGGYPESQTVAIKADGSGEVLWSNRDKCYEQSMLAYNGYLYSNTDGGILVCRDGKTGQEMWKTRMGGDVSSSPLLSGDNIYFGNEAGDLWVVKANPQAFEVVSKNKLGDELFATPIVSQGKLYARFADSSQGKRQEYLICIGER
ncbi:PQQ-binding-like beta-propeller repeat protein [Bremerella cremea]|uniref:outer membrane protein assembly factor BamB family protein n=1 Tax=Bremerella cremea TaxID=1031537 RepID=UPI0031E6939C